MTPSWLRFRWLFNCRVGVALLWAAILVAAAVAANLAGIYLFGSIESWERWMTNRSGYFLLWRLCLYAATVCGWRWMRRRLLTREPGIESRRRLIRTEIAGVVAITALECSLLLRDF